MNREKKNEILHKNYRLNIDRFKLAYDNHYQIEALCVIYALLEQKTSNLLVRLSSIDKKSYDIIFNKIKEKKHVGIACKIDLLKTIIKNEELSIRILGSKEKAEELRTALISINERRNYRNNVIHSLMLMKDINNIRSINEKLFDAFRILDKNNKRLKSYIKNNNINKDVAIISNKLEGNK